MKVAIVHDWLVAYGGAEQFLNDLLSIYPKADIFALVDFLPKDKRDFILNKKVNTSFIQKLPKAKTKYRSYLPFMPMAIEQLDLSKYDLIISSSHCVAKGIITGPDQIHISYVHSPIRYAWDLQNQYLKEAGLDKGLKGWIAKAILHYMRIWDTRTANGVDYFIANSKFIARRIWKCYHRKANVIYSGINLDDFSFSDKKDDFYFTASRMVPYKKMDLIVEAFTQMPDKKLIVIGTGPDFDKIQKIAQGHENIKLMGYQPFEVLKDHMQRAKAFVFAAEEDFGRVPVEAQACGTPVIAFGKGGALETVRGLGIKDKPTGIFFDKQTKDSLIDAVNNFEQQANLIKYKDCRNNALEFGLDKFRYNFKLYVDKIIEKYNLK
ncbi:glycosyltransferase family 4 protein [Megamonas hypermegale]|uniref:glycosyltransferase family 4 protein n=1 Tax=Megamonas hypermegale TaxID=158847 RepID=UPI00242E6CC1|nr:glycosyltransferase family 4 protein [Megamonas hypermegale]